jgi:hypothetical protein
VLCEYEENKPLRFTAKEPLPFNFQYVQMPLRF